MNGDTKARLNLPGKASCVRLALINHVMGFVPESRIWTIQHVDGTQEVMDISTLI